MDLLVFVWIAPPSGCLILATPRRFNGVLRNGQDDVMPIAKLFFTTVSVTDVCGSAQQQQALNLQAHGVVHLAGDFFKATAGVEMLTDGVAGHGLDLGKL